MKKSRKVISLFLIVVLIFSLSVIDSFAESVEDVDYMVHSAEYYFQGIEENLCFETVDGSDYIYIVVDGEAVLLSFRTNFKGPEKSVFTLPTFLGGYPVTTIGYEIKSNGSKRSYDASWFIHHGDDVFTEYPELIYYPDWDPGLNYVSCFVIPEGYRKICNNSLAGVGCQVSFPKSLRTISGTPFEGLYTDVRSDTNKKFTVLPECQYINPTSFPIAYSVWGATYFPSRLGSEWLVDYFYRGEIYIPYNYSYKTITSSFFFYYYDPVSDEQQWQADQEKNYGKNTIVHCAPDSEFLKAYNAITLNNYYTVITDVVPAEYIAFPSDVVNVSVGEVMDLEAKTYPAEAIWTACDYTVSDPSIVKIDEYSGRITALKEGTVTVTATHCERGYVDTCTVNVTTKPEPGVNGIEPATDTPYVTYGNRDYKINVTGSPSKIQVVRDNGGTTTIDRRKATVTSNGDTETWIVNMRVEAGTHNIRAKYGNVWDDKLTPFTVKYDLPGAYSFDLTYENGIGKFDVVTDPEVIKIQFALDNGCTLTYSQTNSYIGEDGLRHWEILRKIPSDTIFTLRTKYGYTWTDTNFEVNTIV